MQAAVNQRWHSLEQPIRERTGLDRIIDWRSPRQEDDWAEYRDGNFLDVVGLNHLRSELASFWPARGPQWDALAVTNRGDVLLVEAKAHIGELCSPPTAAIPASRALISERLEDCARALRAHSGHGAWTENFYQLANRLAHLAFLREHGVSAWLVLVNFLNDEDMSGPSSPEVWQAAYEVAMHVMGLPKRHPLSRFVIEVYPDLRAGAGMTAYASAQLKHIAAAPQ